MMGQFPSRGLTVILGTLAALGAAAIDMYLPGLPTIAADLDAAPGQVQLTLSAFFLGLGFGQLLYGAVSDALGRRRVMMVGVTLYCVASVGCIFATDVNELILARFIQAVGAAAGQVIARAMVRDVFELDDAARAQSFINLAFLVTPLLAPVIGGYVLIWFGWRAIFLVLCLFGTGCLLALALRVPETLPPERRTSLSIPLLLRNYATILRERQSLGCMLTSAFAFACMFTYFAVSPFVFITLFGVADEHYGFLFGLNVIGLMAANYLNAYLVLRFGALKMLRVGSLVSATSGMTLFVIIWFGIGGLAGVVIPLIVVVGSLGFVGGNAIAGALAPFPRLAATTASLFGFGQMMLAGSVGAIAGLLHDGTALPMGIMIAVLSGFGFMFCLLLVRVRDGAEATPAS